MANVLADNTGYPLLDVFWTMLWLFLWILWIFLLIRIINDIFRSPDLSGGAKAAWTIFLIILPLIGALAYLIARGARMHEHEIQRAETAETDLRSYIQQAAGSSPSIAEELAKLAELRDRGVLTATEFDTQKAWLLSHSPS